MRAFDVLARDDDYPGVVAEGMTGRTVLAFVLVAGCLGSPEGPPADPCGGPDAPADCGPCDDAYCVSPEANATGVPAPDLPLGRAWTYEVASFYEPAFTEVTVVVAEKDEGGYLFAGASPEDLAPEAVWWRDWHGPHDRGLVRDGYRWIDFPLVDGKTWELSEGFPLVAHAAEVTYPGGSGPGFVIEGSKEEDGVTRTLRAEYAPSVGAATRMLYEVPATGYVESLELTRVSEAAAYAWFERGPRGECDAYADTPPTALVEATPFEVPEGHDAVLLSAGGVGGRGGLVVPGGATWTGEGGATETWTTATFAASPGTWTLSCAGAPDRWYFLAAQTVRWVEADVGSGAFTAAGEAGATSGVRP